MKDKYDLEIERLTEMVAIQGQGALSASWANSSPLFGACTISGDYETIYCGCLTQIRYCNSSVVEIHPDINDELTEAIKNDNRIPFNPHSITVHSLPVFAEWQRKLDVYREQYRNA